MAMYSLHNEHTFLFTLDQVNRLLNNFSLALPNIVLHTIPLKKNSLNKRPHCLFQDYEFTDQPSRSATTDISSYKGFAYDGVQLMARSLDRFIRTNQPDVNWDVWRQPSNYTSIISGISFKGMTVRGNNHFYECEVIIMANFRI